MALLSFPTTWRHSNNGKNDNSPHSMYSRVFIIAAKKANLKTAFRCRVYWLLNL